MPGRLPTPPSAPRLARCRSPVLPTATGWRAPGQDVWPARAGASTIRSYLQAAYDRASGSITETLNPCPAPGRYGGGAGVPYGAGVGPCEGRRLASSAWAAGLVPLAGPVWAPARSVCLAGRAWAFAALPCLAGRVWAP